MAVINSLFGRILVGMLFCLLCNLLQSGNFVQAGCPFCSALSGTISDEIGEAKVAVIAKCIAFSPAKSDRELHSGKVFITTTLKGNEHLTGKLEWDVPTIDPMIEGESYLLVAFNCEPLELGGAVKLSSIAQNYLKAIDTLPAKGRNRLKYFLKYVELDDKVVADDAFNEFARATFQEVSTLKEDLDREHVLKVIRDPKTSLSLRRLFWSFLSICGKPEDANLFHELRTRAKEDSTFPLGLEAAVACYISLRGVEGLSEIQRSILENPKSDGSEIYLTILAIRVHAEEIGQLKKSELAQALKPVLKRIDFADQVLPDLARWEEWSVLPEVVDLFRRMKDPSENHVRVPIIRFAMACPLPEAKQALATFAELDPDATRRAKTMFGVPAVKN